MTTRRGFLGAILAAGIAPAVCKAELLMPVRQIWVPSGELFLFDLHRGLWVNSSASGRGDGSDPANALPSIAAAVALMEKMKAPPADITLMVGPGHTEFLKPNQQLDTQYFAHTVFDGVTFVGLSERNPVKHNRFDAC